MKDRLISSAPRQRNSLSSPAYLVLSPRILLFSSFSFFPFPSPSIFLRYLLFLLISFFLRFLPFPPLPLPSSFHPTRYRGSDVTRGSLTPLRRGWGREPGLGKRKGGGVTARNLINSSKTKISRYAHRPSSSSASSSYSSSFSYFFLLRLLVLSLLLLLLLFIFFLQLLLLLFLGFLPPHPTTFFSFPSLQSCEEGMAARKGMEVGQWGSREVLAFHNRVMRSASSSCADLHLHALHSTTFLFSFIFRHSLSYPYIPI